MTLARPASARRRPSPRTDRFQLPVEHLDPRLMMSATSHTAVAATVAAAALSVPLTQVPLLHSRSSAAVKLYLDFDGDNTPAWESYHPGVTPAYSTDPDTTSFSDTEVANIREIWARVSDLFSPFNIDVTTQDPGTLADFKAIRVVVGGRGAWMGPTPEGGIAGGVASLSSFTNDGPNTAFVFSDIVTSGQPKGISTAIAHEAGHAFGLDHQSTFVGTTREHEYNPGTDLTAPIMGVAYGSGRALWWRGTDIYGPTSIQEDLFTLTAGINGFGYRADDRGNTAATATAFTLGSTVSGVVERTTDVDYFKFTTTSAGYVTVTGNVPQFSRMLDPIVELRDASGNLIATGDGPFLNSGEYHGDVVTRYLAAGTYTVSVRGHGLVSTTAQPGAAANLGSFYDIGQYTLTATLTPTAPQQAYPNPSTPFVIRPGTTTVLQAENFDSGGEGVAYHDVDARNLPGQYRPTDGVDIEPATDTGGGYAIGYTKPGEWLEYTVDVDFTGLDQQLSLRLASAGAGAALHVEVDGKDVTGSLAVPNTGGWQKWQDVTKTSVFMAPGRHVIRVVFDKANSTGFVANLNSLTFAPYVYVPPTQDPYTGTPFGLGQQVDAENYDTGGEGVAYHDLDPANGGAYRHNEGADTEVTTDTGGGYDVGFVKAGEWLEYTLNVPTSGLYDLQFRLANAAAGAKFHVEVSSFNITGAIDVPNTGGYQKWQTVTRTTQLIAGVQTLRIVFDAAAPTGFAGNFNWFKFTPPANPTRVVVQAEDYLPGGEGVAYHDADAANLPGRYRPADGVDIETTADTGGGFGVGYVKAGEWLKYGFDLTESGVWRLDFRLASAYAGGKFHFELDAVADPTVITVPNTGGYQTWQTVTATNLAPAPGHHTLRLVMDQNASSGFVANFNYFSLTRIA